MKTDLLGLALQYLIANNIGVPADNKIIKHFNFIYETDENEVQTIKLMNSCYAKLSDNPDIVLADNQTMISLNVQDDTGKPEQFGTMIFKDLKEVK